MLLRGCVAAAQQRVGQRRPGARPLLHLPAHPGGRGRPGAPPPGRVRHRRLGGPVRSGVPARLLQAQVGERADGGDGAFGVTVLDNCDATSAFIPSAALSTFSVHGLPLYEVPYIFFIFM